MMTIRLKDLSPSLVTRARGAEAFRALQERLASHDVQDSILFVYAEDDIIFFLFLTSFFSAVSSMSVIRFCF